MGRAPRTIYINGRFLTQKVTGIQRYARETLRELDALIGNHAIARSIRWVLLAPRGTEFPALTSIVTHAGGRLHGHPWEQVDLPILARDGILLSFASTGPLTKRDQVITVHDASVYQVPDAFSWKFKLWYRVVIRLIVAQAPRTLAVSHFSAGELVKWFGGRKERIRVTSEGWQHLARIQADARVLGEHQLEAGRYVLAVSSPTPNKNFRLIVQAAEKLEARGLVFAVAGSTDASVFASSQLEHSATVKRLGYVSDAELKALYENALCFVFPSRYEGFGIPPLEAMSLGCPVLASRIGATTEVCSDAAKFFEPDDAAALASAIEALAHDGDRVRDMKQRGLARARDYSWRDAAQRTLDSVLELVH